MRGRDGLEAGAAQDRLGARGGEVGAVAGQVEVQPVDQPRCGLAGVEFGTPTTTRPPRREPARSRAPAPRPAPRGARARARERRRRGRSRSAPSMPRRRHRPARGSRHPGAARRGLDPARVEAAPAQFLDQPPLARADVEHARARREPGPAQHPRRLADGRALQRAHQRARSRRPRRVGALLVGLGARRVACGDRRSAQRAARQRERPARPPARTPEPHRSHCSQRPAAGRADRRVHAPRRSAPATSSSVSAAVCESVIAAATPSPRPAGRRSRARAARRGCAAGRDRSPGAAAARSARRRSRSGRRSSSSARCRRCRRRRGRRRRERVRADDVAHVGEVARRGHVAGADDRLGRAGGLGDRDLARDRADHVVLELARARRG